MTATTPRLRIAILAHSTNPRGGVVHALALADALTELGHIAVLHAPDPSGRGFFRPSDCRTVSVPASPIGSDVAEMVEIRAGEYVSYFENAANRGFDVWHAQDGISGNALATLKERGLIPGFARTVHHIDSFHDPRLHAMQLRAITSADRHFVVSRTWQDVLARDFGLAAPIVGNGVRRREFSPVPDGTDAILRRTLKLTGRPVFLSIGGVEERKNTLRLFDAFCRVRLTFPDAQFVIAGGASVLDHTAWRCQFDAALAQSGLPSDAVQLTGPLPQHLMAALYRSADTLVFPSVKEGFGLVVLEAMASGVPVVTSRIAPFTEYLGEGDVAWCDPQEPASIAEAMVASLAPAARRTWIARGHELAARHDWTTVAERHLAVYAELAEPVHA
ncbi:MULTISPECIES: MSMEG_0565 family glycosyltransferase [Rhodomicrobium]|uniref:MSMEG_0565 family glycosyltransferase n=1 Tax=Rhodomicrobium TaxID=1068 RepID=UPI000B4A5FD6|nr:MULTISPECIES: MSMEG_0565 family glycosyltransferase [Rhodomicrobium]